MKFYITDVVSNNLIIWWNCIISFKNIKNHGYLKNTEVQKLQSLSKFTIVSGENIYSIFTVECLLNNVKILIDKKYYNQISFLKKQFVIIDFSKINTFLDLKNKIN